MGKETFGQLIKRYRILENLTLRDVEDLAGISNPYLSQLETGKITSPSANIVFSLIDLYHIPVEEIHQFFGLKDENISIRKGILLKSKI